MVACGHHADLLTCLSLDRIGSPRDSLVLKLDSHKLLLRALSLLPNEGILAYEFLLVKLAEHSETCLDRGDVV